MRVRKRETTEKYLETILVLSKSKPVVRCVDIAEELGLNKSSVSLALKNLREEDYITVSKDKFIFFTDAGREIAETIYECHEVLREWLIKIGVNQEIATEDARRMKHDISHESLEAIKKQLRTGSSLCDFPTR